MASSFCDGPSQMPFFWRNGTRKNYLADDVAFGVWEKDSSFPRMYGHRCQKTCCGMEDVAIKLLSEDSAKK